MPTTAQELIVISLVLAGAIGWELLRNRGRPGIAIGWLIAFASAASLLVGHWHIAVGL